MILPTMRFPPCMLPSQLLISLLDQCKSMKALKQIHGRVIFTGLSSDNFLLSRLLLSSADSDSTDLCYTHRLFHSIPDPTTFVWNTIIRACSRAKNPNWALTHFVRMLRSGLRPDHLTFPSLGKSCARLASIGIASSVHCCAAKAGLALDRFIANSVIHMYSSCGEIELARKVFDEMPNPNSVTQNSLLDGYAKCGEMAVARELFDGMQERDIVSWSALINGYARNGAYEEALDVFARMQAEGTRANTVTMVSVLSACAHLGALDRGRAMHRYVQDNGLEMSLALATSIVDMYAKCGAVDEALRVFHSMPHSERDVLMWNAMIGGLAMHGCGQESLNLYAEMKASGVTPDEITYLGLLSACVHGGRVNDAWRLFQSIQVRGMAPHVEHYACMADVLGRSGRVEEAWALVEDMPVEPSASVLGALLNACHLHGKVELGEEVAKRLIQLEPDADGRYVSLSNIYASGRRWGEARSARKAMEERGVRKAPGRSSVEVDGELCGFSAHARFHPRSQEIYLILSILLEQMTTPQPTDFNLFD